MWLPKLVEVVGPPARLHNNSRMLPCLQHCFIVLTSFCCTAHTITPWGLSFSPSMPEVKVYEVKAMLEVFSPRRHSLAWMQPIIATNQGPLYRTNRNCKILNLTFQLATASRDAFFENANAVAMERLIYPSHKQKEEKTADYSWTNGAWLWNIPLGREPEKSLLKIYS